MLLFGTKPLTEMEFLLLLLKWTTFCNLVFPSRGPDLHMFWCCGTWIFGTQSWIKSSPFSRVLKEKKSENFMV